MSLTRTCLALAALLTVGCKAPPAPLRIAAAADLRYALDDLVKAFRQQHADVRIEPAYGSSGMFYAQLTNRAPFDLFLSADVQYPQKLAEQGLVLPGSEFSYADGRIVLWSGNATGVDVERLGMDALRQPAVRHIAIANPAHAPYGRAAEAALRSLGIYDAVKDKLVMGENISQTFQMAQSGAAEVGIVAL
jgi:molybdate transport system substrate-binding protein